MQAIRRLDGFLLLAVVLSLVAVAPLLAPGYFWGAHDARHSVYFLFEFDRSIQDGILYPRWSPDFNFGYGYPFFNIYSPGVFYLGEAFHLAGLNFVDAVKGVFALSFLLSALSMYVYAHRVLDNRVAALVASVVYVYVPYHLADVFLRGALADSFCFALFPLVLWSFHDLIERPRWRALIVAGATLAGLMFTHYTLALLFLPFLGVYGLAVCFFMARDGHVVASESTQANGTRAHRRRLALSDATPLVWAMGAGIYALALAAVLILPAALEYRYIRTDQWAGGYYIYADHFVYPFQFFAPTWGYGVGSVAGADDTLPFQLGAVPLVLSVMSLPALAALRRRQQAQNVQRLIVFYQLATMALLVLMLDLSLPLWDALHLAVFAQFPWRLLSLTTLTMAVLSGIVVLPEQQGAEAGVPLPTLAALLAVIILGSYSYLRPQMTDPPEGPVSLAGLMRFQQSSGEMTGMTAWATRPRPPSWSPLADVYVAGGVVDDKIVRDRLAPGVQAITTRHTTVREEVKVITPQPTEIAFYTAYHPGWQATLDGVPVEITPAGDLGQMTVAVPAGEHTLVLRFEDTQPRRVGIIVSLLAAMAGVALARRR